MERRTRFVDMVGRLRIRPESARERPARGVIGVGLALLAIALHAATAWRYGYFRDELYFIAAAKHLAWGYVDQPPLVAFAAWLASPAGYHLLALRALPILAAALTVYLAVRLARELGGGAFAQLLAGTATLLLPAYLLLGNTLTTTSFEPLFWTLAVYLTIRVVRAPAPSPLWGVALGVTVALGAYGKYSIFLLVAGILAGLLATPERRVLRWPLLAWGAGTAVLLLAPNLLWQGAHGWPIVEVLRGDASHRPAFANGVALEYRSAVVNAFSFALEQLVYTNPLAAPVWIAGIVAPFRLAALRDLRFVSIAYVVVFVFAVALSAKGYYIVGIYAALLAIGAVALERAAVALRATLFALLVGVAVVTLPLSLPVLPVDGLIAYSRALGLTGRGGAPAMLIQPVFAEEFGWERLARDVAVVYGSLPSAERERTAVYADTYGDAGALDFFGPAYGLPPAISSQNTYYLWGTRGYDGNPLIAIGATRIDLLRRFYRQCDLVRTSSEPYKQIVEGPAPIYLCRDPVAPLSAIWPHLRWYGA
ncbi:MAG: glycosyltransferase family 39 protein [Candidatus Baltobacteraceae bacterium]